MTRWLIGLSLPILVLAFAAPGDAQDKADDKWTPLFNGKDLSGWKLHPKPSGSIEEVITKEKDGKVIAFEGKLKDGKTVTLWKVEDGILIGAGPPSHLFSQRDDYENFHYRIEAQINDKGNSGQYFRTQFGPNFPKGYEAQINSTHGDKIRTGSLYMPSIKEVIVLEQLHKPDTWFTQEVIVNGNHIQIIVDGKKTVDFKDEKNTYAKGHFALQGHDPGTTVKFKKIEVKELPPTKK
jgi:hypothetical protein